MLTPNASRSLIPASSTLEVLQARLDVLDALIATTHARIVGDRSTARYELEPRPLAFGLPLSHAHAWESLGSSMLDGTGLLPGDTRWSGPGARKTLITGPVDPSVAFAVAVGLGGL